MKPAENDGELNLEAQWFDSLSVITLSENLEKYWKGKNIDHNWIMLQSKKNQVEMSMSYAQVDSSWIPQDISNEF